jgi:uncharacterized coiled-coil DUF342 family protein
MSSSDEITNKILSSFEDITDLKEYANSQYKTIITQSKKITELERKVDQLTSSLDNAEKRVAVANTLAPNQEENSDTETTCLVQLAMLKGLAMNRELTLEEVKKLEILAKTLMLIKGKPSKEEKEKDNGKRISTEELLKLVGSLDV